MNFAKALSSDPRIRDREREFQLQFQKSLTNNKTSKHGEPKSICNMRFANGKITYETYSCSIWHHFNWKILQWKTTTNKREKKVTSICAVNTGNWMQANKLGWVGCWFLFGLLLFFYYIVYLSIANFFNCIDFLTDEANILSANSSFRSLVCFFNDFQKLFA